MAGWVDRDKIALANKASNEDERRKQAMGSFGLMTVHVAAATAEAGTYQLAPKDGGPQTGTVIVDEDEDAGLSSTLTSQSGTLTIKSVTMNDSGSWVLAVEGVFEGQFSGRDGSSREFSSDFRFVPEAK